MKMEFGFPVLHFKATVNDALIRTHHDFADTGEGPKLGNAAKKTLSDRRVARRHQNVVDVSTQVTNTARTRKENTLDNRRRLNT
jgi:hypothetical protein